MKINAPLDLAGNELKNFIVHNATTNITGILPEAGKLIYDTTDRCMYFGTNKNGITTWSRLVDTEHIDIFPVASTYQDGLMTREHVANLNEVYKLKDNTYTPMFSAVKTTLQYQPSDVYRDSWTSAHEAFAKKSNGGVTLYFDPYNKRHYIKVGSGMYGELRNLSNNLLFPTVGTMVVCENDVFVWASDQNLYPKWTKIDFSKAEAAYGWGSHKAAGYAKATDLAECVKYADGYARAYKAENVFELSVAGLDIFENLTDLTTKKGTGWEMRMLAFEKMEGKVYAKCTKSGDSGVCYLGAWGSSALYRIPSSQDLNTDGNLLFVRENATVYKRDNGAWVEYFSGASQDVINKIDEIREALGLDEDSDDIIDTWNEIKEYFANLDEGAGSEELLAAIATKADKDKVVEKPVAAVGNVGDVLSLEYYDGKNRTTWKKTKIVKNSLNSDLESDIVNGEWRIDITELGETLDVNVSLYRVINANQREMILADVYVEKAEVSGEAIYQARINFGNYDKNAQYIAVITG